MADDIPEIEGEKLTTDSAPSQFANKVIPIQELEKNSGSFPIPDELNTIKNITLLSSAVKPIDQIANIDEEWNYDVLHTEIGRIVRMHYGEYYDK